jgi:TPR repeat protein
MPKLLLSLFLFIAIANAVTFKEAKEVERKYGVLKALSFYKELAEDNNKKAIFELAKIYFQGREVKKSLILAKKYLERGSNLGDDKSTFFLGKLYLSKKSPYHNLTLSYNTFVKAANNDYAPAQNMIGQFLVNGVGVDKDYKLAVKLFEKAAKQNFIEAQCNLAFMYATGKGVFINLGRAHQFAKKGKELGVKRCEYVWKEYNLKKYPEDKGFKFNFYTTPKEE